MKDRLVPLPVTLTLVFAFEALGGVGCAGTPPPPPEAPQTSPTVSAPPVAEAAVTPPAHPYAKSADEATAFIDEAINDRAPQVFRCIDAARIRRKDPHAKVAIDIGLDQEGHLLGVKSPTGTPADPALSACVQDALQGAPFPRSNAGVITVRKVFEDKSVTR